MREAHVFRFGADWVEMCPLFEEFCAVIGCDPNAPLVCNELRLGYVHFFANLFGFSLHEAGEVTMENKVVLFHLIDEFLEADLADLNQMDSFCILLGCRIPFQQEFRIWGFVPCVLCTVLPAFIGRWVLTRQFLCWMEFNMMPPLWSGLSRLL